MRPEVRYARNGEVAIAYAVIGTGPDDLLYLSPYNNLDIVWENPLYERFLRRLSSSSRLIVIDRRGTGVSDAIRPTIFRYWRTSSTILKLFSTKWGLSAPRCSASQTREPYVR